MWLKVNKKLDKPPHQRLPPKRNNILQVTARIKLEEIPPFIPIQRQTSISVYPDINKTSQDQTITMQVLVSNCL